MKRSGSVFGNEGLPQYGFVCIGREPEEWAEELAKHVWGTVVPRLVSDFSAQALDGEAEPFYRIGECVVARMR